ncbi:MAG: ATP-dependent RecD-like DNA helicase [Tissierellia bacterium]|nr:ATP-dependent RecD-like DNA helicase [Tissierellia bacterium]
MLRIEGSITQLIYYNEENGYTVALLETEDGEITAVGTIPGAQIGRHYEMEGDLVYHSKYGEQFKIEIAISSAPQSKEAVLRYLSSGWIPYIGPATAQKIIDTFGEDALEIIEEDPTVLKAIRGLGPKRIKKIAEALEKQKNNRNALVYLQGLGISTNQAMRIYNRYREETILKIQENPYQLVEEIRGIGFGQADSIAAKGGVQKDSSFRVTSGIQYLLKDAANSNGDCFLYRDALLPQAVELLDLPEEMIEHKIDELIIEGKLIQDLVGKQRVIYYERLYEAEELVATRLVQLLCTEGPGSQLVIPEAVEEDGIYLDEKQRQAVTQAMENQVLVITGGPGTGKTTIIKRLLSLAKGAGHTVKLCAPTGRAAKRMEESTGFQASTIHRLLKYRRDEQTGFLQFEHDRDHPISCDMLIVDEASMIDIELMERLVDAIPLSTQLILVGDVDQLPSVGPGNVLRDIIKSSLVKTIVLDKIYRQSANSNIVVNAHRINQGKWPTLNEEGKDFFFIRSLDPRKTSGVLVELLQHRLPSYYGYDPLKDIQVLTPTKRGEVGQIALNQQLKLSLNPEKAGASGEEVEIFPYREGDKVMQIVNNYNLSTTDTEGEASEGIYNGDMGVVESIDHENEQLRVRFDDGSYADYDPVSANELMLSYAITIHKSQGSEFPVVIIPMHAAAPILMTRNLIYTAITRARSLVVLVGDEQILRRMIANNSIQSRNSSLAERMNLKIQIFGE